MGKKNTQETLKKESEVVKFLKDEVERVTGLNCEVVPQSDTWYDGFCLDTGNLGLHLFRLGDLEERLLQVKEHIENHKKKGVGRFTPILDSGELGEVQEVDYTTIKLIHNGVGRNLWN